MRVAAGGGNGRDAAPPVDPAAVVIRFRPTDPDRVLASAEVERRRIGRFGLSVFADVARPDEDEDAVVARLLVAADLAGMGSDRHPKFWICATASEFLDEGFVFYKDEDDVDELPEHFSVDLGDVATLTDVRRFLDRFGPQGGRRR
jgi:hypothetical protein